MSTNSFNIANPIKVANPVADLDAFYGPYTSVAEACAGVPAALRKGGRKVGVYVSGKVVDYYWPADDKLADGDLEQKSAGAGSGGGTAAISTLTIAALTDLNRADLVDGLYLIKGLFFGYLFQITNNSTIRQYLNHDDKMLVRDITISSTGTQLIEKSFAVMDVPEPYTYFRLDTYTVSGGNPDNLHLEELIDTNYRLTRMFDNASVNNTVNIAFTFIDGDDTVILAEPTVADTTFFFEFSKTVTTTSATYGDWDDTIAFAMQSDLNTTNANFLDHYRDLNLHTSASEKAVWNAKENAGVAAGLVDQVVDGAGTSYSTLKKIQDKLSAVEAIIGDAGGDANAIVDTVRELLAVFANYQEGTDIVTLLSGKVNMTDIYNALDCIVSGKTLDARQGKVLNDALTALTTSFNNHTANHAPAGAQVNVIESMSIGGVDVPITAKKLTVSVDDSVTVTLSNGVMTVGISDAYKKKITLAQFM